MTAAAMAIGGCSPPPAEQRVERGIGVGTGGAAAHARSDGEFVPDVATMTMAAIDLSRMALEKATNADVRSFAETVMHDDTAAMNSLKSIVSGHSSIRWPEELGDKHRKTAEELARKQGAEFDGGYLDAIIERHVDLAARLESRLDPQSLSDWKTEAAARTRNQALPEPEVLMGDVPLRPNASDNELTMQVNQWAAATYPVTQKHLDTARRLDNATKKRSTD
jgi:putative membrane protein